MASPYHDVMTRAEAEERARRLQAESPERDTHRFIARPDGEDGWEVVRVELPRHLGHEDLTPTVAASPRPSQPDDPRTGHERRVPGSPGGVY
jgi:hypothetical protein